MLQIPAVFHWSSLGGWEGINLPPPGSGERPVNGSAPQARLHTKGRQSRGTEKGPRPTGPQTNRAPDTPGPRPTGPQTHQAPGPLTHRAPDPPGPRPTGPQTNRPPEPPGPRPTGGVERAVEEKAGC
ncbi:unnamed protein product [Arctogadus glacialis]